TRHPALFRCPDADPHLSRSAGLGRLPGAGRLLHADRGVARHQPRLGDVGLSDRLRAADLSPGGTRHLHHPRSRRRARRRMIVVISSIFLVALVVGVPIAFGMGLAGSTWIIFFEGLDPTVVVRRMYGIMSSFPLLAIPLFSMIGILAERCGL